MSVAQEYLCVAQQTRRMEGWWYVFGEHGTVPYAKALGASRGVQSPDCVQAIVACDRAAQKRLEHEAP